MSAPYIVTTKRQPHPLAFANELETRRAVATLDEARRLVLRTIDRHGARQRDRRAACGLPGSGGTVTLPDGTVIELKTTTWYVLWKTWRNPGLPSPILESAVAGDPDAQQRILDAYNARRSA